MKTICVLWTAYPRWLNPTSKKEKQTFEAFNLLGELGNKKGYNVVLGLEKNYSSGSFPEVITLGKKNTKIRNQKVDVILDRCWNSKTWKKSKLKIQETTPLLNNPILNNICWDKFKTTDLFQKFMIPSYIVSTNQELQDLAKKLPTNKIVIKPNTGIMGRGVQIRSKENLPRIRTKKLVQRFIDTSQGIKELDIKGTHDFRVLVLSGKILHAYVRKPKEGLVANIALGGSVQHVEKVPQKVKNIIKKIDDKLKKYGPRVYSADFLFENGTNPILSELESTPVIDSAYKADSSKNKQRAFIGGIIDELIKLIK